MRTRTEAVSSAMDDIRSIERELGVSRAAVEAIRDRLLELASQRELFPLDDFPAPGPGTEEASHMYRLAQDDDDRFVLYAQSTDGPKSTPVHNHTTWAVVVGFEGEELNRFYERTEDGVAEVGRHSVQAGTGVAMLADDLHAIEIDGRSLNFHCYGMALERLDQREYFSEPDKTWKIFGDTGEIREARPDRSNG